MSIRHHPTDDLLLAYAAGNLREGWSLAVATHLSLCHACRLRDAQLAAIGGAALEDITDTAIADNALADCLARLDGEARDAMDAPAVYPAAIGGAAFPRPLYDYAGGDIDSIRWSMVGGGIRQRLLHFTSDARADGVRARLVRIEPGASVPEHGHRGLELTLVLAGSFDDGNHDYRRGDIEVADEGVRHTLVAGYGEPCICLAVTDAPLMFRGWLPRLAQRFAKI